MEEKIKPINYLIGKYDIDKLNRSEIIFIKEPLTKLEIDNLKFIPVDKEICFLHEDYDNIAEVLDNIVKINKKANITISITNKDLFRKSKIFNDSKYESIINSIKYEKKFISDFIFGETTFDKYKKGEILLDKMVEPILKGNYSPFEKYIFAYIIAKRYKSYKEVPQEKDLKESRDVYEILFNDYIVCSGYANLLLALLEKIGIPCFEKSFDVIISKENEPFKKDGHTRVLFHMEDPKYGIKGYYNSDPTWDNSRGVDSFAYCIASNEEAIYLDKFISNIDKNYSLDCIILELFNAFDVEDFFYKLNGILSNPENYSDAKKDILAKNKRALGIKDNEEFRNIMCKRIMDNSLKLIEILDVKKAKELEKRHNSIYNKKFKKKFRKYIEEASVYISSMVNRPVEKSSILEAIMTVMKNEVFLSDEDQTKKYKDAIEWENHLYQ